jgi:hypothetical protein
MRVIGLAVVLALSLTFAPRAAEAQQAPKVARIGYLAGNLAATPHRGRRPSVKHCVTSATSKGATS